MSVYILVIIGIVVLVGFLLVLGAVLVIAGGRKRKNETPLIGQINETGDLGEE